jgi:enoyl-CoA hydratase
MESGKILCRIESGIAHITISNERRRNAISLAMWRQLLKYLLEAEIDDRTRTIVISGAGSLAFSSGADISEFRTVRSTPEQVAIYEGVAIQVQQTLERLSKPSVALVEGICYGGGVNLAMACDIRLAAENATFCVPAARIGIGYSLDEVLVLVAKFGRATATDLLLSGLPLSAHDARSGGIVQRLWPVEVFHVQASAYITAISQNAPLSMAAIKKSLASVRPVVADTERAEISRLASLCDSSNDFREGQAAFLEKRQPKFTSS